MARRAHQQGALQAGACADADAGVADVRAAAARGAVRALHPAAAAARELDHHARHGHAAAQHCGRKQDSTLTRAYIGFGLGPKNSTTAPAMGMPPQSTARQGEIVPLTRVKG